MKELSTAQSYLRVFWLVAALEVRLGHAVPLRTVRFAAAFCEATGASLGLELRRPPSLGVVRPVIGAAERLEPHGLELALSYLVENTKGLYCLNGTYGRGKASHGLQARVDKHWLSIMQERLELLPLHAEQRLAVYAAAACGLYYERHSYAAPVTDQVQAASWDYGADVPLPAGLKPAQLQQVLANICQKLPQPDWGDNQYCTGCGSDMSKPGTVRRLYLVPNVPTPYGLGLSTRRIALGRIRAGQYEPDETLPDQSEPVPDSVCCRFCQAELPC